MIFIAKNHKGKIISILSAKTVESVNAYLQGQGIHPHTLVPFDLNEIRENEEQGYVTPILSTMEVKGYTLSPSSDVIIVK